MLYVEVSSRLKCKRQVIWESISSINGANKEFYPLLKMTCPFPDLRINPSLITDRPLFRSWLLLFGLFPIEFDLIRLTKVIENECFEEKSSMALISEWNHHRYLSTPSNDNETIVIDTIQFLPRIPGSGLIFLFVVRWLFQYRHFRLRQMFG